MSVVVRRVGPEAAADVLAVVREAFGARPVLDPPADALSEDVDSVARLMRARGGFLATIDGAPVGCVVLDPSPDGLVLRRFGVTPAAQGRGTIPDLILQADEVVRVRADIEGILSRATGQSVETLRADTDHDRVFTAAGARDYGLLDHVLDQRQPNGAAVGA